MKITGKRQEVVWNQKSGFEPGAATIPVTIFVNLGRAELKTVVPALREALFFHSAEEARASVARTFGGTAPADPQVNPALAQKLDGPGPQVCDCADHGTDSCKRKVAVGGGTPFKLVHMAEPMFSAEARGHRLSGAVELTFLVDGQGNVTDVWVTRPLGYGLDEQAARAVENSTYQPATCHNQPVKVPVHISVNFSIF